MKTAIFCAKPYSIFVISALLPDDVTQIISASGVEFCTEVVSRHLSCSYYLAETVDEAIEKAEFILAIWNGTSQKIVDAVKIANKSGKRVMFSFMP